MLVTNETVSEHFYWLGIPFVYRIHETPSSNKMEALNKFVNTYGYFVKGDTEEVHPKAIQAISKGIKGKKEEKEFFRCKEPEPECSGFFVRKKLKNHKKSLLRIRNQKGQAVVEYVIIIVVVAVVVIAAVVCVYFFVIKKKK